MKEHEFDQRIALGALCAARCERAEQQPLAVVRSDVGAFALLPDQDAVLDQIVDCLAQVPMETLNSGRQLPFGRNQLFPGFSSPDANCSIRGALHAFVERAAVGAVQ